MRTLVEYGLANAVSATALAAVALLVGLVVRRPAVRHALWVLVLLRLMLPPVWTIPLPVPTSDAPAEVPVVASAHVDPAPDDRPLSDVEWPLAASPAVALSSEPATGPATPDHLPVEIASAESAPVEPRVSMFVMLGFIWLAGTAFVGFRSVHRIARFHRALRDAISAPATIQQQADDLARGLGLRRCPTILLVPGRVWPSLWMPGLFARQARLILPAGLLPLLDARQRAAVLVHELAHLRRGDPWVRWLELAVSGLYWWHPLLGWFRRKLRQAEEECCDMWVVAALRGRRDYATALVETAAYLGDAGPAPALASGAGPVRHLQRRVTMIMRATWPARLTRLGLAAMLGVGGLGLAFGPALAQERKEERKAPPGKDEDRARERAKEKEERKAPPVREEDRPRERAKDKERPELPPRDRVGGGDREAIEKARESLERARKIAHEAMEALRAAEEAVARAEGRPIPPRDRGPGDRGPGERGPGDRGPGDRRLDPAPMPPGFPGRPPGVPMPPGAPGAARRPDAEGGEFRDLQQQVEELRRALEQMRQELRRDRGGAGGDRKDPGPREGRPKEEPKRPNREPERQDF